MGRTKDRAIAQFDSSAAPISLGVKFNNFNSFNINPNVVEDENSELDYPFLFTNEIMNLPVTTESLVLLANDLDPPIRDMYAKEVQQSESAPTSSIEQKMVIISDSDTSASNLISEMIELPADQNKSEQQYLVETKVISDSPVVNVSDNKFKIKHAEIKRELTGQQPVNKAVTAFRLVNLAIDKMSSQHKSRFKLEELAENESHSVLGSALIDKSVTSVKFINQLGQRILNLLLQKFPSRFKEFPKDERMHIDWLNSNIRSNNKLDFLTLCAMLAKRIKFSHIELNSLVGLDCGYNGSWRHMTCHQVLSFLNLSTIDINSTAFANFERVIHEFPKIHGGTRLFYLEYLISEAKSGNIFFDSKSVRFFDDLDERWSNHSFRLFNVINDYWIDNILKRD
jgi:hypothetical protein